MEIDNNTMIILTTIVLGSIAMCIKSLFRYKCKHVDFCGIINIDRSVEIEDKSISNDNNV